MGKTSIEWTDASWNPIVGCTEVSPGCANCYAARLSSTRLRHHPDYAGLAIHRVNSGRWNGEVRFLPERIEEPLHWKKPRRIFVCDMGDLFHEKVETTWLLAIFAVMERCPQHTFQILTKRADRMRTFIERNPGSWEYTTTAPKPKGLPNVWLGVSVENQHFADERIPLLLQTPAALRFISAEPLLGPVNLLRAGLGPKMPNDASGWLHWVIAGGESGPHARPMHPDWARSLRDQCQAAGVPFFFKQWGEWGSGGGHPAGTPGKFHLIGNDSLLISTPINSYPRSFDSFGSSVLEKLGKKKAGRLLDGREWNEFPGV